MEKTAISAMEQSANSPIDQVHIWAYDRDLHGDQTRPFNMKCISKGH
jgi:hypothetical protein